MSHARDKEIKVCRLNLNQDDTQFYPTVEISSPQHNNSEKG